VSYTKKVMELVRSQKERIEDLEARLKEAQKGNRQYHAENQRLTEEKELADSSLRTVRNRLMHFCYLFRMGVEEWETAGEPKAASDVQLLGWIGERLVNANLLGHRMRYHIISLMGGTDTNSINTCNLLLSILEEKKPPLA
jgi:putative IMPACT (imprinted ancient) family translation regulator